MQHSVFLAVLLAQAVLGCDPNYVPSVDCPTEAETNLVRNCWRNLTPDAKDRLADFKKDAEGWRAHTDRPHMFVRGQFFYGLERNDYLHNFFERPLHQDSSMAVANEKGHMLNPLSWKRTVQTVREMHLDGFAFFPSNPGCWDIVPRSVMPGGEVPLLPELHDGDRRGGVEHCLAVLERVRKMPNAYRINGKIVVTCYPVVSWNNHAAIDLWPKLKEAARAKFGADEFAFVPYLWVFDMGDLDKKQMTAQMLDVTRERLRGMLRKTDGLVYWLRESAWAPASLLRMPHQQVVIPLVKSVLNEPEFKDKLLGIGYWQGHENCYRIFKDEDSHGLIRLKTALDEIDSMRPDFSIGFEWDEENENTHFCPTVSNGQTTQRLMRYYIDKMRQTPLQPYPCDDITRPNLVLAYRKSLECGEVAEAQVMNIPDGTAMPGRFRVSFRWIDDEGRTVEKFEDRYLSSEDCSLVSFKCPSSKLLKSRIVRPELVVSGAGYPEVSYQDGFWPLNVEANRNLDSKWVRQALRELPTSVSGKFRISERRADGSYTVSGSVSSKKNLRAIEILENSDTVYMYDKEKTNADIRVSVSFYALPVYWKEHSTTGTIRILNAPHMKLSETLSHMAGRVNGGWDMNFNPARFNFQSTRFADLPVEEAKDAVIEVLLPKEGLSWRVRVIDLLADDARVYGIDGGAQIAFRMERKTSLLPSPQFVNEAAFSFSFKPLNPLSVLRLQVVDEDYRVWRSAAATILQPTGKTRCFHVYDALTDRAEEITIDASRLVSLKYDFSNGTFGDLWLSKPWMDMPMAGGGGVGMGTWLACGDGYWYAHAHAEDRPDFTVKPGHDVTVPRRVKENDGYPAIRFTGCSFASLPHEFLPRNAGYELSLRLKPNKTDGNRGVLDSGNLGMSLWLKEGVPCAFICLGNAMIRNGVNDTAGITLQGQPLKVGEWNDVRIFFDQQVAWIEVNGARSKSITACGPQANPRTMAIGMLLRTMEYFDGFLGALALEPR